VNTSNVFKGLSQLQIAGPSATFHEGAGYDGESYDAFPIYDNDGPYPSYQQTYELQHAHNQYHRHDQQDIYNLQSVDRYGNLVGGSQNRSSHDTTTSVQMRSTQRAQNSSSTTRRGRSRTIHIQIQRTRGAGSEDSNGYHVSTRVSDGTQHNPPNGRHVLDAQRYNLYILIKKPS
jgi:hypothetical protein